jgi:Co/Zn/Cd efflux system component
MPRPPADFLTTLSETRESEAVAVKRLSWHRPRSLLRWAARPETHPRAPCCWSVVPKPDGAGRPHLRGSRLRGAEAALDELALVLVGRLLARIGSASADPAALESAPIRESEEVEDAPNQGGALNHPVSTRDSRVAVDSPRAVLVASALRLSYFTIAWNGITGAAALTISFLTGSLALTAFALNALLDSSASTILVWRFTKERSDPALAQRLERRAQALIAGAMLVVALYIGTEALRALAYDSHADESPFGIAIALISLFVLPWLATRKLRVASALPSRALRGDGVLTLAAATLAAITLLALLATARLGWWWADPVAALVIATALALEATRVALHHRFASATRTTKRNAVPFTER